jgi:hypothetical protein
VKNRADKSLLGDPIVLPPGPRMSNGTAWSPGEPVPSLTYAMIDDEIIPLDQVPQYLADRRDTAEVERLERLRSDFRQLGLLKEPEEAEPEVEAKTRRPRRLTNKGS